MNTVILEPHKESSVGHDADISLAIILVGICIWTGFPSALLISQRLG